MKEEGGRGGLPKVIGAGPQPNGEGEKSMGCPREEGK